MTDIKNGPLAGLRVVEFTGLGPAPFCCMMLADLGADVLRIERASSRDDSKSADLLIMERMGKPIERDGTFRGREAIGLDLKDPSGVAEALAHVESADVLIEGFRPGVMERLGLGPDIVLKRNKKLVFGRVTGWGQEGPLAQRAGHDINYLALSGALHTIARAGEAPVPPLALLGDFAGGSLFLAVGVLAAIIEAQRTGVGKVVDAAIVDGAAYLTTLAQGYRQNGVISDEPGTNMLDTGSHFYNVYKTADDRYITVGAAEPKFYARLLATLGLDDWAVAEQYDAHGWPEKKARFADIFASKTRAEWERIFEGQDACFAPVLSLCEAPQHPHNRARSVFVSEEGRIRPNAAPRFISPSAFGAENDEG